MLGLGVPLVIAVATIPILISTLGATRFGILTLIWAIVSYFGVFDLGLGRAVTQRMAVAIGEDRIADFRIIIGTAAALMLGLSLLSSIIMLSLGYYFSEEIAGSVDASEIRRSIYWMALGMPAIILTSCFRGVLEAVGRFDVVNLIRLPMGVFTFVGPVIAIYFWSNRLDAIAATLVIGRMVAFWIHCKYALRLADTSYSTAVFDKKMVPSLLNYGGWLTVTNIASPIMTYLDRFLIGILISPAAVASYVTAQELIIRLSIIPSAIVSVMFPRIAKSIQRDDVDQMDSVRSYSILVAVSVIPILLIVAIFAHEILAIWISEDFAASSYRVLQILALSGVFSALAQAPYTFIQAIGRSKVTGVVHLAELPIYCLLVYLFSINYGIVGTAFAWLFRVLFDMMIMWFFAYYYIRHGDAIKSK